MPKSARKSAQVQISRAAILRILKELEDLIDIILGTVGKTRCGLDANSVQALHRSLDRLTEKAPKKAAKRKKR